MKGKVTYSKGNIKIGMILQDEGKYFRCQGDISSKEFNYKIEQII